MPRKTDVLGVPVSIAPVMEIADLVLNPPPGGISVAVSNVHAVMSARNNADLAIALNKADVVTPDGMPLVWAIRIGGHIVQERVTGFDLFEATVSGGVGQCARHFFYGSTARVLERLTSNVSERHRGVEIVGCHAPPFRGLTEADVVDAVQRIRASGATIVWLGLGMPKQELFMHQIQPILPGVAVVGIGAVFDWVAGNKKRAPVWLQNRGLEWAFRLLQDPKRLWRRYVFNNPLFLALLARELLRSRLSRN